MKEGLPRGVDTLTLVGKNNTQLTVSKEAWTPQRIEPYAAKPQAISINSNPGEITYGPDGTRIVTTWEATHPDEEVSLTHAQLAEASHVVIALEKGVGVINAEAGVNEGVTRLRRMDDTVAAGHIDEGGAGFDTWVLMQRRANIPSEKSKANAIKRKRATARKVIATRLARQGSASGSEMEADFRRVLDEEAHGKKGIVTVSIINADGTERQLRQDARQNATVLIPGEWAEPKPRRPQVESTTETATNDEASAISSPEREETSGTENVADLTKYRRMREAREAEKFEHAKERAEQQDAAAIEDVRAKLALLQPAA